ncbi:MAG: APC family permease [Chloroflexi bacterium]|nr:APC family permease [Chloroflexota bacterium]
MSRSTSSKRHRCASSSRWSTTSTCSRRASRRASKLRSHSSSCPSSCPAIGGIGRSSTNPLVACGERWSVGYTPSSSTYRIDAGRPPRFNPPFPCAPCRPLQPDVLPDPPEVGGVLADRAAKPRPGRKPGDRRVRVRRPHEPYFRYVDGGALVAKPEASAPRSSIGRLAARLRSVLFGRPLSTYEEVRERLGIVPGLSIFASDNISSSAYATEEIMRVLVLAGAGALVLTMPITIGIVVVLAIVVTSYRQTIAAYPGGGGSYIVASDNLGTLPGLTAAAALLTDYVLTVAVSVAAGVAALTSIWPELFPVRVAVGVGLVAVIAFVNLRGVRESGLVFSVPTYVYLVSMFGLLGYGVLRFATGSMPDYTPPPGWAEAAAEPLGLLLILRAFASGSVALTGTEAVSNGVPAFRPPEARNAAIVIVLMGACFGTIFLGMSFLSSQLGVLPDPTEQETVVSQLTRVFVGGGTPVHYLVQVSTAVLLILAANTSFADFPRLSSILARDSFLPRVFQFRGDRLAFNSGIVVLAAVAIALIAAFDASVTNLIPLYTVGVFIAFTLSQGGMVRRWWRLRGETARWRLRATVNGIGALTTGVVAIEVAAAKFALGAWVVLILIPLLILGMLFIRYQYRSTARQLAVRDDIVVAGLRRRERVVVPVAGIDRSVIQAINVGRSIARDVQAVLVTDDPDAASRIRERWERQLPSGDLVVVESPYRALVGPLLSYLDVLDNGRPEEEPAPITFVIVPEFVARHWWERLLYNQSAKRLRAAVLGRPHTVVVDVPYRRENHPA